MARNISSVAGFTGCLSTNAHFSDAVFRRSGAPGRYRLMHYINYRRSPVSERMLCRLIHYPIYLFNRCRLIHYLIYLFNRRCRLIHYLIYLFNRRCRLIHYLIYLFNRCRLHYLNYLLHPSSQRMMYRSVHRLVLLQHDLEPL